MRVFCIRFEYYCILVLSWMLPLVIRMGNTQARRRLNAKDFQYIANNTALLNMQIVTE